MPKPWTRNKVNPAPGGFVNLGAMLMQLLICDKGGVEVGAVLFKVGFPQPPVMPDIRARGGGGVAIVNEYSHAISRPANGTATVTFPAR